MQIFVNYPKTDNKTKILSNNLATFKAKLLLKSINNLDVDDKTKNEVLVKVLEILDSKPEGDVI